MPLLKFGKYIFLQRIVIDLIIPSKTVQSVSKLNEFAIIYAVVTG